MSEQIQTEDQPIVFANQQAFENAVLKIIQEQLIIKHTQKTQMYDPYINHIFTLEIKSEDKSEPFSQTEFYTEH